jgi:hypothetical protein
MRKKIMSVKAHYQHTLDDFFKWLGDDRSAFWNNISPNKHLLFWIIIKLILKENKVYEIT